jgi:ABC-2 type transport system permease protein
MKFHRISAIIRRHFLLTFRRLDRVINVLYWPFLNIVIWGITSVWLQQQAKDPHIVTMILTGLVLWQIVFRVNLETAKGMFEELLSHNVVNLFSTPLTFTEWVVGMMVMGIINMLLVFVCCAAAVYLLYGINMLVLGFALIPFMLSLLIAGWFIGFFICGLLIRWGLKAQDFVFTVGWVFAPFSAIYYPLEVLPPAVQTIGKCLPMTYVFESMRSILQTGKLQWDSLFMSFGLDLLYLILALFFFWYMFELSKEKGLARLE